MSAFLLFSVEPLVTKQILPWFGGSAAVWSAALVFFQTALLVGYLYAALSARYLRARAQASLHIVLLLASTVMLPIGPDRNRYASVAAEPSWAILQLLLLTIGPAFVVLSATSPLLQAWLARAGNAVPYRMFAVSNAASLTALLSYPFLVEPLLDIHTQRIWWSLLYVLFAAMCAVVAWQSAQQRRLALAVRVPNDEVTLRAATPRRIHVLWFALAACGSMLLLAITNHIDENIAAVPLLWVVPLATYLLTFVLAFGSPAVYRRDSFTRLLAFALGILGYSIYSIDAIQAIQVSLPIALAGLFICCLFCHGELNRLRPPASGLTSFYVSMAVGGAAGAVFVGLVAPRIFSGVYELPIALAVTAALALIVTWTDRLWALRMLWFCVLACMLVVLILNIQAYRRNSLSLRRSFYGSLRVVQTPLAGLQQERILYHGTIEHGSEFLLLPRRRRATTYYGPDSGIGIVLRECFTGPKQVGVVGLGTGTVAVYGRPGDSFRFYEINPQVADVAASLFYYLRESAAHTEVVIGDARLSLARDTSRRFDALALDAFSGDAIPVHLLTREAMALYLQRLAANGILAFHVSNNYLNLAPVVAQLAESAGYRAVLVHSKSNPEESILAADWVIVTNSSAVLENASVRLRAQPISSRAGMRLWTDDYNNLLEIFRAPKMQ